MRKRIGRFLVIAWISLVLFSCVFWFRSYSCSDEAVWARQDRSYLLARSAGPGELQVVLATGAPLNVPLHVSSGFQFEAPTAEELHDAIPRIWFVYDTPHDVKRWECAKVKLMKASIADIVSHRVLPVPPAGSAAGLAIRFPWWAATAAIGAIGFIPLCSLGRHAFRTLRNRWRQKNKRCTTCNYDLRAHKPGDQCPECGTVIIQG